MKCFNLHIVLIIVRRQLSSIDSRKSFVLVLLDRSAAFDTVDHFFLLSRLSARFGICDHALNWLRSYLSDRTQFVRVQDASSHVNDLLYGVPEGPCWVLCCFHCIHPHWVTLQDLMACLIIFMRMIRSNICPLKRHLLRISQFVNLLLKTALGKLTCGLVNKLKLNSKKTEILVLSSSYCPLPALNNLVIASETVDCSTTARNIGVIFNNSLSMLPHVTAVCKSSFFHLRNIFKIRKFLSYDTCKILIHALITSRIDYCNSLLYGQP